MAGTFTISYTLEEIAQAAAAFWQWAAPYDTIAFSGEMGAGKTTLIRTICQQLGITDNVSSPTFSIISEYHIPSGTKKIMYHMDWYRLNSDTEAINAGVEDCLLQPDTWCLVEWPEKVPGLIRAPYIWVDIAPHNENGRTLTATVKER